jgi:hypothetical protein
VYGYKRFPRISNNRLAWVNSAFASTPIGGLYFSNIYYDADLTDSSPAVGLLSPITNDDPPQLDLSTRMSPVITGNTVAWLNIPYYGDLYSIRQLTLPNGQPSAFPLPSQARVQSFDFSGTYLVWSDNRAGDGGDIYVLDTTQGPGRTRRTFSSSSRSTEKSPHFRNHGGMGG